ncbi:MAG: VOC family protein [Thermodesulfobacteriota bacterium]|nr:VOC family protein [Thermodesulfobacteriota bacterium]
MVIDHIGIAVRSLENGIKRWHEIFGYQQMTEIVVNTRQKVKVVFLRKENSIMIKLVEPLDESSPIYRFAKKGGGLHHLCFKCDNLELQINVLKEKGLRVLTELQPGEAFENENIAFVFAKHGMNIELIDTDKKAFQI